ncbi:hypothetical protein AMTR_s00062p00106420 [Amborella trichopoda]|uniref:Uncharacterized protein n=1 Tax=Amborella trichopoda TaxID=13333 RepID=U5D1V3_AMBTC|nr:hypothetical protein AMTR_s00062p00106420 [Amborella trichopoda]
MASKWARPGFYLDRALYFGLTRPFRPGGKFWGFPGHISGLALVKSSIPEAQSKAHNRPCFGPRTARNPGVALKPRGPDHWHPYPPKIKAMSIIINPLAEIAKILVSPLIRQIGYLISSKSNARDLALENERLKARRSDLMREVEAAERNGNMATSEAQVWFKRAEDLQKEADKVIDTYNEKKSCCGGGGFVQIAPPTTSWERMQQSNFQKSQLTLMERIQFIGPWMHHHNWGERCLQHHSQRQRFMLILDDLWEKLDLKIIGVPQPDPHNRCKVIITTRFLDVCNEMDTDKTKKVDVLDVEDSWNLFHKIVGEVVDFPTIEPLALEVIEECGGLPLAIITVASAMKGKSSIPVWKNALRALRRASTEIKGMEPQDYTISKEQLVEYWIWEGFIGGVDSIEDARNKGHALIESLIDSCMVERVPGDDTLVMLHDVIRDLAIWISSSSGEVGKFVVEAGLGLKEARKGREWKDAERISLFLNEIERLPNRLECSHDPTLILQQNKTLVNIPDGFFECMNLRCLLLT